MNWNLQDILDAARVSEYTQLYAKIDLAVNEFVSFTRAKVENHAIVSVTSTDFVQMVSQREQISELLSFLSSYISLQSSIDTQNEEFKVAERKYSDYTTDISNKLRFFRLWFIALPKETAYEFASALDTPEFAYGYAYKLMHDLGAHTLSDEAENIISHKDVAVEEFVQLYDTFCSSLTFELDGTKSLQQMRTLLLNPDRAIRKRAHELLVESHEKHMFIVSNIYVALVRDYYNEQIVLRKYESPISVRLSREGLTQKAISALFSSVKKHTGLFQEYFKLKAKMMGLAKLAPYDIGVSLFAQTEQVSFTEGLARTIAIANSVDSEFGEIVSRLKPHIDAEVVPGKRGGAFCLSLSSGVSPYVFMQYENTFNDMMTLAHELGHAVHGEFCKNMPTYAHHATIGVCESASTFFEEMVLAKSIADAKESGDLEKVKGYLAQSINEAFSTICLQAYVAMSEVSFHEKIRGGATTAELTAEWAKCQSEMFGDSVELDSSQSWAYRPHIFHSPFYCYNYAIGNILALLILAKKQRMSAADFAGAYKSYLQTGGTADTIDTAKLLGIDLEDEETYDLAFGIIQDRLTELRKLV